MNRVEKRFVLTAPVAVIHLIWFYMVSKFFFNNDMLISIHSGVSAVLDFENIQHYKQGL